jgi:hypothetical protein
MYLSIAEHIYESWDLIALIAGIASFITAITVIATAIKKVSNGLSKNTLSPVMEKLDKTQSCINKLTREILKLTITNNELSLSERIRAFDDYEKLGGNGEIKVYVNTAIKPLLENKLKNKEK